MTDTFAPPTEQVWPVNACPDDVTMLDTPVDILCSYHYFKDVDMGAIASWGCRTIGDSGAFSAMSTGAPIDREEFHRWAARWERDLFWTAALDVIGDQQATQRNWQAAQDDGLNLVPTVHYGSAPTALDWYVDRGVDFIGLGGMVGFSSEADRLMRWLIPMFKRVRDNYPHVRFHGWGISHPLLMDSLPWWSADSSGFASAFRFGTLRLFLPRQGKFVQVDLNGRDLAKYRNVLARYYGIEDWTTAAVSTPETRRVVGRLALRAVQLYGQWLRARQQVSAPASLRARLTAGPLLAGAMAYPGTAQNLAIEPAGPLTVGAAGTADGSQLRSLNPDGETGPLTAAAAAGGDKQLRSRGLHPTLDGPHSIAALGAPAMQPSRALSPSNDQPMMAVNPDNGPVPVLAVGISDGVMNPYTDTCHFKEKR